MTSERDRLNQIIDQHGLNITRVHPMELRDQSYARVCDALAAKLAEVDAARSAVIRMSVAEISDLKAALKTARNDALDEAAQLLEPKNPVDDWTDFARQHHADAIDIRALIENETKS